MVQVVLDLPDEVASLLYPIEDNRAKELLLTRGWLHPGEHRGSHASSRHGCKVNRTGSTAGNGWRRLALNSTVLYPKNQQTAGY